MKEHSIPKIWNKIKELINGKLDKGSFTGTIEELHSTANESYDHIFNSAQKDNVVSYSTNTTPEYLLIKTSQDYGTYAMPNIIIEGRGLNASYTMGSILNINFYFYDGEIYKPTAFLITGNNTKLNKPIFILNYEGKYCIAIPGGYCCAFDVRVSCSKGHYGFNNKNWTVTESNLEFINSVSQKKEVPIAEAMTTENIHIQKNANGYCKLPNGLILQLGSIAGGDARVAYFPIAFSGSNTYKIFVECDRPDTPTSGSLYKPYAYGQASTAVWIAPTYRNPADTNGTHNQFYGEDTQWFAVGY